MLNAHALLSAILVAQITGTPTSAFTSSAKAQWQAGALDALKLPGLS